MILNLLDHRTKLTGSGEASDGLWPTSSGHWQIVSGLAEEIGEKNWFVNVVLVDNSDMECFNQKHRNVEGVTDVLSFSYLACCGYAEPDLQAGKYWAFTELWLDEPKIFPEEAGSGVNVGEIILAPAFILERCRTEKWHIENELALLVVHGCLHVMGWEHSTDSDRVAMQKTEQVILSHADLPHPLIGRSLTADE